MIDPIGKIISSIYRHQHIFISRALISGKCRIGPGQIYVFLGGCFMVLLGNRNPFFFAASVLPALIATQMLRPPSVNILLEQGRDDAGAASSLMSFTGLFFGGLMAFFISLDWNNRILVYGIINIAVGLLCSAFWPRVWKKCSVV